MLLGEILIRKNLISCQQLNSILTQQQTTKKKLGESLLEDGLISAEELEKALQEQYWRQHGYWVIGAIDRSIKCEHTLSRDITRETSLIFDDLPKKSLILQFTDTI